MGNMDGIRRVRIARKIRSTINGIWENEIVSMISKEDIDMEYLDMMTKTILKIEESYKDILEKYDLKITSNKTIHKCKFPGIPRRFEVEYDPYDRRANNSPLSTWNNYYNDESNGVSFIMMYNAYVKIFKVGNIKDYYKGALNSKRLKVNKIHVLEDSTTVADMIDVATNKPYRFNMSRDITTILDNNK